jgi:2-amino-4-hydroxy-6-hydroxymethyldihydropteridine diphosphokinase
MTHLVYLGLGSNTDPEHNLRCGLEELETRYDLIDVSGVVKSAAVGFDGEPFLNLVVYLQVTASLQDLHTTLRSIEFAYGRTEDCTKFSSRTLDIDILTFDDLQGEHHGIILPRPETTRNAFVLGPFAEVAPDLVLPGESLSLRALWEAYDKVEQVLEPVCLIRESGDAARKFKL